MRYILIVLIAVILSSCGSDGEESGHPSNVFPATTGVAPSSPTSSPPDLASSPDTDGSPITGEDLTDALPSVETVEGALGIGLVDREVRNDLSQAFEGADFSAITDGVVGLYRESDREAYAIIDIAQFEDVIAAEAFFVPIREQGNAGSGIRQEIDVDGIGDEAKGFIGTEPDAHIGIVYLRVDDVVSIIVVRQPDDDGLDEGLRRLADVIAKEIDDARKRD